MPQAELTSEEMEKYYDKECKLCPAHPFIVMQLSNNQKDIKWIMRTQIVQLGSILIGTMGAILTLGLILVKIIPRLPT